MKLEDIEKLIKNKTPGLWTGAANAPFYATLEKPAPSLSKHDDERPTYWRIQDVEFVLAMANGGAEFLVDEIKRLQNEIKAAYSETALKEQE